jgi:hypothetical protein
VAVEGDTRTGAAATFSSSTFNPISFRKENLMGSLYMPLSAVVAAILEDSKTSLAAMRPELRSAYLEQRTSEVCGMLSLAIKLYWPDEYKDALLAHHAELIQLQIHDRR